MATGRVPTTANSPLTAKGDLFGYSTTQARVPVGNDGETIVADSSTSTGLRYQAPYSQQPILNSAMQIWQRGTSFSSINGQKQFAADRWETNSSNGTGTISRQVTGDTTNLPNIQYCTRFQRTAGQTLTGGNYLIQNLETVNSIPFSGKTVTVSYYARAGANFSGTFFPWFGYGTGTDQNVLNGLTGQTTLYNTTATLTTNWQRFSFTVAVPSTSTQLALYFAHSATGTAGAADYFDLTGVQLELGSVATPFHTYAGTIQGELAACQRYYVRFNSSNGAGVLPVTGYTSSTTNFWGNIVLPTTMRVIPSSVDFSTLQLVDTATGTYSVTNVSLTNSGYQTASADFTVSGATAGRYGFVRMNGSTSAYLGFSAEL